MKELKPYGVSVKEGGYIDASEARGHTYTTSNDGYPSTNLACADNPFAKEIKTATNILDIGCGVGRNLPWIMENTSAHYWGLDPNDGMTKYFWDIQDKQWINRVTLVSAFEQLQHKVVIFDAVVSTFVFQHIGYRPPEGQMNVSDITKEVMKYTHPGTIWFLYEHEREEQWISRWMMENEILPADVYLRGYTGLPELTERGTDHHLIIWKQR